MAKRSNPYIDDLIPQSKTYVGIKQFNNNKDRMQKVYEKTLHLLFKGANKSPDVLKKITEPVPSTKKNCMKQLLINKDGTLGDSAIVELGDQCTVQKCVCGSQSVESQCCYCEAALCPTCSRPCARCSLAFCSNCSLHGAEGTEICVSCYG